MPPQSRGVTCIYSPDVADHRRRPRELPFHLDQLPASRVLAEAALPQLYGPGASQHQLVCARGTLQHMCGVRRTVEPSGATTFMVHGSCRKLAADRFSAETNHLLRFYATWHWNRPCKV